MAVDKNKIVAEATRYVQKGQYDKALKAYEKILAEDRREVRTLLKVGEIHQKRGDTAAAATTFNNVAEIYGEQGFFLKAVAVYKQIAKLTPDDIRVNEKLAGLYQQLGLLNDATNQLQAVATAHEKAGDQGRHLDVLRRLLDLDPENVVTCQRLGDLYAKASRTAEALELYRRAAVHLRENKRGDEYVKLAERIFQLTPDDLPLARELAQEHLARGDTKKALGKLQICHGADKQDVDTLRLMAQAFRDLGQVSKTIAVYRALARVYAERGRRDEAAVTWRMVQDLLPDDPEAQEELAASGAASSHPVPTAGPRATEPAPPAPEAPVHPGGVRPPEVRPAPPQVSRPPPAVHAVQVNPVTRILTETDVYLKYGLHQKALDHVLEILETDPENPDALERVRDIRDALGDQPGAAEAAERTVKALLTRGDEGRIAHATERLRQLDPSHAEMVVEPAPPAVDDLPPPEDETPAESPAETVPEPVPEPEEQVLIVPPDEEAPMPVAGPEGPAPVEDDEAPPLEVEVEEVEAEAVEEVAQVAPPPPVLVPPPLPERASWEPLDAEMEEVEFYERQGLLDEALLAVRELAASHPGHPAAAQALDRIERLAALEESAPEAPTDDTAARPPSPDGPGREAYGSTGTTGIFDLGAELSAELGPELTPTPTGEFQYSVADVFDQFKRGLEKTVRPDDSATKYDLGIAFQEMGMLDEALEQFRSALAGGDRRRDAEILNMIGVCLGMKGRHGEAIEAYQQALRSEFLTEDAAKALHFELGAAHEALGEPEVALWHFQKVAHGDPSYRGVAGKVSHLGGGPGRAPGSAPPGEVEAAPQGKKTRKR